MVKVPWNWCRRSKHSSRIVEVFQTDKTSYAQSNDAHSTTSYTIQVHIAIARETICLHNSAGKVESKIQCTLWNLRGYV